MKKRIGLALALTLIVAAALPVYAQGGDGEESPGDPLGGATEFAQAGQPTDVTLILDWTPNTNHLGFYVAQALGYFEDANLRVTIQEPTDLLVETVVTSGAAQFGVSYQEFFTYARADDVPVVSLAAIIQHNTSGFVTLADQDPVSTPADMAGLRYGGFGQPDLEQAMLNQLLVCDGAEPGTIEYIDVGFADPIPLMQQDRVDLVWLYWGWSGIDAEQRGVELDRIMLTDYLECVPDYYTPILITSEQMIDEQPDVVAAFVQASARGFAYAIENPAEAAGMLIEAVPELNADLVRTSADWLAPQYQADAPRWGEQSLDIWEGYTEFLVENGILAEGIDEEAAFINEFLPGSADAAAQE
ncbi:MAG: ABC transporter substrate-binding protein [Chloroflexi bacterium]|nr:ABC transporter substrate-binding protein [Chloroflexota bacterium]